MTIDPKMFRAYDIRGTYPDQLNRDTAEKIGKGFGTYLRNKHRKEMPDIVVGMDARVHSSELQEAFIFGLLSTGCNVANIGLATSPYLYFANTVGGFDGGCNITASHNPEEYNGFKMMTKKAHAVYGDEIQDILGIIEKGGFKTGNGKKVSADYYDQYLNKLKEIFQFPHPLRIVTDTANGVAGRFYPQILKQLGHEVITLYKELDGGFPNHEPDAIVEANLKDLKQKVIDKNADIGLAFDGDGDRVGIVTEKGKFTTSDQILMLLAKDILSRKKGGSIVFTVSNSQSLFDLVKKWGGKPIMCEVGHSFVENAMSKYKAVLGGEQSGHFFVTENFYHYDDALVAACRILNIISQENRIISEILDEFPKTYSEPEMRPYCSDDEKFDVLKKIKAYFEGKYPSVTIDGIRMDFGEGGWCGIRVSNTSPRISITMEAQTKDHLAEIKSTVLKHLKCYKEINWDK